MAKEEKAEQASEEGDKKAGASTLKIVIIAVTVALLFGGGLVGATFYFVNNMNAEQAAAAAAGEGGEVEKKVIAPPQYHSMDPKFVVSFENQRKARFMQFSLEVMTREDESIKQLEAHRPAVRSSLLMLFGSQSYEEMVTREGKEKLLQQAVEDINKTLQEISGSSEPVTAIEAAYFDSFVIQ